MYGTEKKEKDTRSLINRVMDGRSSLKKCFLKKGLVLLWVALLAVAIAFVSRYTAEIESGSGSQQDARFVPMEENSLQSVYPQAEKLEMRDSLRGDLYGKFGQKVGWVLYSGYAAEGVYGYGGRVPLYIVFDNDSRIQGIVLGQNHESPSYVRRLHRSGFMETWNGKTAAEAQQVRPDAVSGCSYSSRAVEMGVYKTLAVFSEQDADPGSGFDYGYWIRMALSLCVVGFGLYFFFFPQKTRRFRLVLYAASVAILGFWNAELLSMDKMYGWLVQGLTFSSAFVFLLFLLAVIIPFFTGKAFYCSYVCPYGAAQMLLSKIPVRKWKVPSSVDRYLRFLPQFLFAACVVAALGTWVDDFTSVEVFSGFRLRSASAWVLGMFGFFLLLSLFVFRPWCRYVCPTGYFLRQFQGDSVSGWKKKERKPESEFGSAKLVRGQSDRKTEGKKGKESLSEDK